MQIHLYISKHASAGRRLRSILQAFAQIFPCTEHKSTNTFGRVVLEHYNDTAIAVIMVGNTEELTQLAKNTMTWDRFKTIVVLPEGDLNKSNLSHLLRPIFVTDMTSDFKAVADILYHISQKQDPTLN